MGGRSLTATARKFNNYKGDGVFSRHRRPDEEKAIIEAALRECRGRVSGPSGAAARLGVPGTTLESKIKALKINKNRFKGRADLPS